jgi:hypothetical protein
MNLYSIFPTPVAKFELGRDFSAEDMGQIEAQLQA